MDKIVETYNPYNQNVERKSSQLPGYINETFINSVEVRSPFIAGNKGYIGGTLQVGQEGIIMNGDTRTISSTNFIDNISGWIINGNGDAQFNNITARGNILGGKTSYSDSTAGYWLGLDGGIPKFNLGNGTNSLNWNGTQLNITGNISASNISGGTVNGATITSTYNDGSTYYNTTVVGGQLSQSYYNISTSARRARLITQAGGIILQASTDSGINYSDTVFISSLVGSSIKYGQISLRYNGTLSGIIEATSSGLSITGNINHSGSITTNNINTNTTSTMYNILPYNTSSWLGSSGNPWDRIYTNDLIAPNATINIYGFKINTGNYFSGAPGGSPIGRIQFQLSNGNVYVLPVYNP